MSIKLKITKILNNIIYIPALLSIVLVITVAGAIEENQAEGRYYSYALIRGLNKVTSKSFVLKVPIGEELHYFGKLAFFVKKCWKISEKQESEMLIEIWHKDIDGDTERVFFGWMLSLRPSISSLEHPIYDLTLMECID